MSDDLIFYTNPQSRGRIARWMLEEVGAEYRTEVIEYGKEMKSPPYIDINPMGKVPAISHRGLVVTETAAICAYPRRCVSGRRAGPYAGGTSGVLSMAVLRGRTAGGGGHQQAPRL